VPKAIADGGFHIERYVIIFAMVCFSISWLWPVRGVVWGGANQEVVALSGLAVAFFLLSPRRVSLTRPIAVIHFLMFLPLLQVCLGSISFSGDGWLNSLYVLAFFASATLSFNLSQNVGRRQQFVELFCAIVLVASFLSALIAIRQWLGIADSIWEMHHQGARPYANFSQPNHLASLLCFAVVSVIYFYERHIFNRISSSLILLFLLVGVVITQSRTSWMVAALMFVLWVRFGRQRELRLSPLVLFSWILVFGSMTLLLPVLSEFMLLTSQSLADRVGASARLDIWSAVLRIIADGPILGFGWGQIPVAQVEYFQKYPIQGGILTYSHNLFLDILLWNGVVIGGGVILFIVAWQVKLLKNVKELDAIAALLVVGVFFTHSMFEYPHAYAYFLIPAGLMLGVAESSREAALSISFPVWLRVTLSIVVVGVLVQVVREYRYFEQNDFNRRMTDAKIIGFDQVELPGGVFILTQLDALQSFQRQDPAAHIESSELDEMALVVARYPTLANIYRYSLSLAASGRLEAAKTQLALLATIHGPTFYELALDQIGDKLGSDVRGALAGPAE
tara:strand:- start:2085 stop:3776 length:1692 start_codon:yes stop_codon:yes gene_type:complete